MIHDHRPTIDSLLKHQLFAPGQTELAELYAGAIENLDLSTLDFLTVRDLLTLSGYHEPPLQALLLLMFGTLAEGSLCLRIEQKSLLPRLRRLSSSQAEALAEAIRQGLYEERWSGLIGTGMQGEATPLVLHTSHGRKFLYFHKYRLLEERLEKQLRGLLERPTAPLADERQLAAVIDHVITKAPVRIGGLPMAFNDDQCRALGLALLRDFVIISGGPGTGKTSIVVAILRTLVRAGIAPSEIRLAAPTGRAAQRLSESVRASLRTLEPGMEAEDLSLADCEATTLHRLLRYQPSRNRFAHHAGNPLAARVVLIDEVSMVDVHTMAHLLDALADGTRLIFLGDKDQLPSVEAGAVLGELIPRDATEQYSQACVRQLGAILPGRRVATTVTTEAPTRDRVAILRQTYRSEPQILQIASQINQQSVTILERIPRLENPDDVGTDLFTMPGCCFFDLTVDTGNRWERLVANWGHWHYGRSTALKDLPSYYELICQSREYDFDAPLIPADDPAAAFLSQLFDAVAAGRILTLLRHGPFGAAGVNQHLAACLRPLLDPRSSGQYFAGTPIMIVRNDHQRQLYNGDVGVVLGSSSGSYRAIFSRNDGFHTYSLNSLPATEPAFANTVHKSQGSEYGRVLLVLPPVAGHRLLTKEILYTGLTRARTLAIIAATPAAFQQALRHSIERQSGLDIWHRPPPPDRDRVTLATTQGLPLFNQE